VGWVVVMDTLSRSDGLVELKEKTEGGLFDAAMVAAT